MNETYFLKHALGRRKKMSRLYKTLKRSHMDSAFADMTGGKRKAAKKPAKKSAKKSASGKKTGAKKAKKSKK